MLNTFIFQKINGLANNSKILDFIGIFFADYFLYISVAILIIFLFWKKHRLMVLSSVVSVFLSRIVITEPIKILIHRARPYIILDTAKKIITENSDFKSFPSGHAAIIFAIATAVYFFNKKLGIFFFISAVLVGIARIFVGVHWPTDILGGAIIGIISGIIIGKIFKRKQLTS